VAVPGPPLALYRAPDCCFISLDPRLGVDLGGARVELKSVAVYIVEVEDQDREKEATRHLLSHLAFRLDLLRYLSLGTGSWVIMEVQKPHLVPGLFGDIDILAGNLELKNPADVCEGVKWPPVSTRIVGVEVKCAYFSQSEGPQSEKDSPKKIKKLRGRIDLLLEMGLNQVGLLDVIGNEATEGVGAFVSTMGRAMDSLRAFQPLIEARLPDDTPAAQYCWAVGSVIGGDERIRGGGGLKVVRAGLENPLLAAGDESAVRNRGTLIKNLTEMFSAVPAPTYWPLFFIDCMQCRNLHFLDDSSCLWKPGSKVAV
jgi:hypothetical protein